MGYQRTGVGRRLYRSLFDILRRQGFHNAFAGIGLPNEASVGLHEAFGFAPIGVYRNVGYKFDRWWDVGWWGLELAAPCATPFDPARFEDLRRAADFNALLDPD